MGAFCSSVENAPEVEILEMKLSEASKVEDVMLKKIKHLEEEKKRLEETNKYLSKEVMKLREEIKERDVELDELLNDHESVKETLDDLKGLSRLT